jgi:non-specific serine/threonine protein kinase/serine/threonine-protein kinase
MENKQRLQRIDALFDALLDEPVDQRQAVLSQLGQEDPRLAEAVLRLLNAAGEAGDLSLKGSLREDALGERLDPDLALLGERIGAFELVELIGRGGMGRVYRAERRDGRFEQTVAIKLVDTGNFASAGVRERFIREQQTLARLNHPGIAGLLDGGVTDQGRAYFVMEHIDGEPIDRYCQERRLGLHARIRLLCEVIEAVHYAHRNLVVHRDLKPSNILVDTSGRVKLLDFGIAKVLEEDAATNLQTQGNDAWMTAYYAAPEQLRGEAITVATDIYQLGNLAYELLAQQRPYADLESSPAKLIEAKLRTRPKLLSQCAPATRRRPLRGDVDAIVLRCLRPEPDLRYGTAREVADDLRAFIQHRPVRARRGRWSYAMGKFLRRNWLAASTASLMVGVLIVALLVTLQQTQVARSERDRAQFEASRNVVVRDHMVTLFRDAANRAATPGEVRASDLVPKAAERLEQEYADDPALRLSVLFALAELALVLNDYETGAPLMRQARDLATQLNEPLLEAKANYELGQSLVRQGDLDLSWDALDSAMAFWQTEPAEYGTEIAQTLMIQGQVLRHRGELDEAGELLEQALAKQVEAAGPDEHDTAIVHNNLANYFNLTGQFDAAEAQFQKAYNIWQQQDRLATLDGANLLNNMATLHHRRGELLAAVERYEEALTLRRQLFAPSAALGGLLTNYGAAMLALDRLDQADSLLHEAHELNLNFAGEASLATASSAYRLAEFYSLRRQPLVAEGLYQQAWDAFAERFGESHFYPARVQLAWARHYFRSEQWSRARERLALALEPLQQGGALASQELALAWMLSARLAMADPVGSEPDAAEGIERAGELLREALPQQHWRLAHWRWLQALMQVQAGEWPADAEPIRLAREQLAAALGGEHRLIVDLSALTQRLSAASGQQDANASPAAS